MAESSRHPQAISLLECLNDSLECGICSEQKELRLLPCQHMICIECLDAIWEGATQSRQAFKCAFCRRTLHEEPTAYPVCRLAIEFQQQIHQLRSALKRRSTIRGASTRRSSLRPKSIELSTGEGEPTSPTENKKSLTEAAKRVSRRVATANDTNVLSEDDESENKSSDEEEVCQMAGCTNTPLQWICKRCHLFLCNSCRSKPCHTESTNTAHSASHIDDAVEESIEYFESVKEMLRVRLFNSDIEKKILTCEIKSLAEKLSQSTARQIVTSDVVQELQEKSKALVAAESEEKSDMETLQTFEEFIKESSDVEYVMVAQWITEERGAEELPERMQFNVSLQMCEQISYKPCHGITQYHDRTMIVSIPGAFAKINLPRCEMMEMNCKFDYGMYASTMYHNERLYCLHRNPSNDTRQVFVRDLNYREICKWSVSNWTGIGGLAVAAGKVFVSNKQFIEVYTTRGKLVRKLAPNLQSTTDFIASENDNLVVCDLQANKVLGFKTDGSKLWSVDVKLPWAICADSFGNLWVWSKEEQRVAVISKEGKCRQKLHHSIFSSLKPADNITSMYIIDSYLWMSSQQKGLFRFRIEMGRTSTHSSAGEVQPPRPPRMRSKN